MKVIGLGKVYKFMAIHTDAKKWLTAWVAEAKSANWTKPLDIKHRYSSASILADNCVIFNVKGHSYRMEIQVAYKTGHVFIKRLGTHAEYERWRH
ncbi:MAG: type II toxin-antitoxin system HigB family toxin [SAR324 cluster bacterium]|nr:type II toxin-antitoxin system HigB family toxin [SAR324 cluster bacterium]